jgi:hypothetical protein
MIFTEDVMAFKMIIEDVFTIAGRGTVVCGKINEGEIKLNDTVYITGLGVKNKSTKVIGIVMFNKLLDEAREGDNVSLLLFNIKKSEVSSGQILVDNINEIKSSENENIMFVNDIDKDCISMPYRRIILVVPDEFKDGNYNITKYRISRAKELFEFSPNHPIINTVYAMAEVYPNTYVQLNEFHAYFKETKHASFIELCASLGAKEICIESAEINNKSLDIKGDIKTPLNSLGLGISIKQNNETGEKIAFKFSQDNKEIKEYYSPWINAEPSWRSMINLRKKSHLQEVGAQFNYTDDMGINAKLYAKMANYGVNIGGNFIEMTKIRLGYNVIFW